MGDLGERRIDRHWWNEPAKPTAEVTNEQAQAWLVRSDDAGRLAKALLDARSEVERQRQRADNWQEVAHNENGRRKAAEARVTELEAATLSFVEGVSFTDHHVRRMREFSVLVDALATERGEGT